MGFSEDLGVQELLFLMILRIQGLGPSLETRVGAIPVWGWGLRVRQSGFRLGVWKSLNPTPPETLNPIP